MGKWFSLGAILFVSCADTIDASGLGDDDNAADSESKTHADPRPPWILQASAVGDDETTPETEADSGDRPEDVATLPDSDAEDAESSDVHSESDTDLIKVDGTPDDGREDVCSLVAHHCPLTDTNYTSCTPAAYTDSLLAEQITHSKSASPTSWIWSGVATIQCDNYHPYPVSAGTPCAHATVTTPGGLVEVVWCAEGTLAGRFRKTADPMAMCPYGTDPIAWW